MADIFGMSDVTGLTESAAGNSGSGLSTGDLRRKYSFGDRVSELAIAQDPFFRMVSKIAKNPTDDPQFKFTERRPSMHKRYAYVVAHGASIGALASSDATVAKASINAGDIYYFRMMSDYKNDGNIGQVYGSSNSIRVGDNGTRPNFFIEGQLVKIPLHATANAATAANAFQVTDYAVGRVQEAILNAEGAVSASANSVDLKLEIVREQDAAGDLELAGWGAGGTAQKDLSANTDDASASEFAGFKIASQLEKARAHVVGNSFGQGSGYPETWKDQPYSTGSGLTQIWKTALAMDNTTRATVLKYEPNEFARIWREKLIEHKWDIETSLLFGSQYTDGDGVQYTQGAVDYILSYGNQFALSLATKTQDDFLDDLSQFLDPRYNNSPATVFFCSTEVYNWLHKLSGYFANNVGAIQPFSSAAGLDVTASDSSKSVGRAGVDMIGKKRAFGVDVTVISTPYGDMNVARNVHLDGSPVKILACNMRHLSYRPLVGNGMNRDTAIYVGVQTLENSGIDRRVDIIQTEAGMEFQMPESHAVWV